MSTPMTAREKDWIDKASYEALLRRWRFEITGSTGIFTGESAAYYAEVMRKKGEELGPIGRVEASKAVGWEP